MFVFLLLLQHVYVFTDPLGEGGCGVWGTFLEHQEPLLLLTVAIKSNYI